MVKRKPGFYAVRIGKTPGIYLSWDECEAQPNNRENTVKPEAPAPSVSSSKVDPLVVYSDGACKGNGKGSSIAGIGVWWGHNDPRNLAERCPGDQTNNRAELYAICRVLETTPFRRSPLTIKTDSKYCIKCFNDWLQNWMQNDWHKRDGSPIKNVGLIRYIVTLLAARSRIGQKVSLQHVKGHSNDEGNDGADDLANVGTTMEEEEEKDWDALREAYDGKVEQLIQARKLQLARKGQEGSLEVIGAEETKDLEEDDAETITVSPSRNKARRIGEKTDAGVKNSLEVPTVRAEFGRRYSAGVSKPSDEELESMVRDLEDAQGISPDATQSRPIPKLFAAQVTEFSEEELQAYADAMNDEDNDFSE
ncbi:hypothetical protein GYMLUDRAFT_273634 [Collybiopsis luxurians FD-317 M1]|nr:hypothetical protein GYMLUDRAFT_273634 [Collybiopsis luxurians FD-317 M1]